jgi:hypothetical protein
MTRTKVSTGTIHTGNTLCILATLTPYADATHTSNRTLNMASITAQHDVTCAMYASPIAIQDLIARHNPAEGVPVAGQGARNQLGITVFHCGHDSLVHHIV